MPARLSRLGGVVALVLTLVVGLPFSAAEAQSGNGNVPPPDSPDAINGLDITPDGGSATVTGGIPTIAVFIAHNGLTTAGTYTFTCSGAKITCGSVEPSSVTIPAGANAEIAVTYTPLNLNTGGTVVLTANPSGETGSYNLTIQIPSVIVTPDGGTAPNRLANSGPYTELFTVRNPANSGSTTYTITCSGSAGVTCTGPTQGSVTLAANTQQDIGANYAVGAAGAGTLTLTATAGSVSDAGSYTVPIVTTLNGPPSAIALRNQNGDNLDRSACLTVGVGEAAAWECGDLVVTHALPSYVTLSRPRSLTLLYNSAQAVPEPAIAVAVTENTSLPRPDSVHAVLTVHNAVQDSITLPGWNSAPAVRQLVLTYSDTNATGIYPFTLVVQNRYNAGGVFGTTVTGNLLVVNRSHSVFGTGWSVAGVEELHLGQPGGAILWVGGDGSARVYASAGNNTWTGAPGAFPDMIVLNTTTGVYTRTLRHGITVTYDSQGRHATTVTRAGQITSFTYDASSRLSTITVPPNGASPTTYTITYTGGVLDKITDPAARVLDATVNASNMLMSLKDPDNFATGFGYDNLGRMALRTTRRGFTTIYKYANALHLTRVAVPTGPPTADSAVTSFEPWDEKGLAVAAVDTAQAFTVVRGPRDGVADDATFWVDRWGAPTQIKDPMGFTTTYTRGNAVVPERVTKVTLADGRVDSMSYDARGNLTQLLDSTAHLGSPNAITNYLYGDQTNAKDSPTKVTDPEGIVTQYAYNSLGLPSQVTAPNQHVTKLTYFTSGSKLGLLKAVTELKVPVWDSVTRSESIDSLHTGFEFNSLGNVVSDTSPMKRVRKYTRDTKQRVTDFFDAGGHRTEYGYDALDRVVTSTQHVEQAGNVGFPADSGYSGPLTTTTHYNIDVLDKVTDPRGVTRSYAYDAANRQVSESDEAGMPEFRAFDKAGLLLSVRLRTGDTVRYEYDADGRRKKAAWGGRDLQPADSVLFSYDNLDRMLTATTRDKRVTRTYYATGNVATDLQDGSAQVTVSQAYSYDRAGKRLWHRIGPANNLLNADSVTYRYNGVTGDLATIAVRWRKKVSTDPIVKDSVQFRWDSLGRRDSVVYSNGTRVAFAYDRDGFLRVLCGTHGTNASGDILNFAMVRKWIDQDGMTRTQTNIAADGLSSCRSNSFVSTEQDTYWARHFLRTQTIGPMSSSWAYDSSGNQLQYITSNGVSFTTRDSMVPNSNRLVRHTNVTGNTWTTYSYDPAGRRLEERPCSPTLGCVSTNVGYRNYRYDGKGRTAGTVEFQCGSWDAIAGKCNGYGFSSPTTCGYDPLGRLTQLCEGGVMGYDGDQPVRTGADNATGAYTFIQGPATDDPLLAFGPSDGKYLFYVTDGDGRQYAVGDRQGSQMLNTLEYSSHGPKFAGPTARSSTYGAARFEQNSQPGLSFFRNRFYDQQTGRWTQEDPIGVAGGANLYQFNGNNPVAYTDPFGLCTKEERGNATQSGTCASDIAEKQSHADASDNTFGEAGFVAGDPVAGALSWAISENAGLAAPTIVRQYGPGQYGSAGGTEAANATEAARHQLWQCGLTTIVGADNAKKLGDAHERGQDGSPDSRRDQINNALGRQWAATGNGDCGRQVITNIRTHAYPRVQDYQR